MSISRISSFREARAGRILSFVLACLISVTMAQTARSAAPKAVALTVAQKFTVTGSTKPLPSDIFTYELKPWPASGQESNPMPDGSVDSAGGKVYRFPIVGTSSGKADITFARPGRYVYQINHVTAAQPKYTYDQRVYKLEIMVDRELNATVIITADGKDSVKLSGIRYEHAYDSNQGVIPTDPGLMLNPPVVKTVSGSPSANSVFGFQLRAGKPTDPMPAGSVNGVKTVEITGMGTAEFGTWSYTLPGIYFYTVSEVNRGEKNYTYDAMVYTITDSVSAVGDQLVLKRVVTNNANRQVSSFTFINTYSGRAPSTGSNGSGPKTGDEFQMLLYTILFFAAGASAMGSAWYLLLHRRRRGKEAS